MKESFEYLLDIIKLKTEILKLDLRELKEESLKSKSLRGFTLGLSMIIMVVSGGLIIDKHKKNKDNQPEISTIEEQPENVIISITNNEIPKNFKQKIRKNNCVIKVSPTGCRYADIYKTIDFIKELAKEYDINVPILYDIENEVLSNDSIYTRANVLLAEEFCNKLLANGFYVGLTGSEEAMEEFDELFKKYTGGTTELYDKLITYEGENNYTGVHSMSIDEEGNLKSAYNLKKIIKKNNYNEEENFIKDKVYKVKAGDTLSEIAEKFKIKLEDLIAYNNLENDTIIYVGSEIKIPNVYGVQTEQKNKIEQKEQKEEKEQKEQKEEKEEKEQKEQKEEKEQKEKKVETNKEKEQKEQKEQKEEKEPKEQKEEKEQKEQKEEKVETNKEKEQKGTSETHTNSIVKGIDINQYHRNIDWKKAKEEGNIQFAIIKLNDFANDEDYYLEKGRREEKYPETNPEFLSQVKGCLENDIPFGIYYYSRATTIEEGKKEAKAVIDALERFIPGTQLLYPVYMDIECKEQQELCKNNKFMPIVDAAMEVFEKNGYFSGVYCNISQVTDINQKKGTEYRKEFLRGNNEEYLEGNNFLADVHEKYSLWLVNNINYNADISIVEFQPTSGTTANILRYGIPMSQYTEVGECPGIKGNVDIDYANSELPEVIEKGGFNKVKKR